MNKTLRSLFVMMFSVLICSYAVSFSATLQVTKIGSLDLAGKVYTAWWYTGSNPTFYGTAAPNSEVTITMDQATVKTTANSEGNWSYAATLPSGDHNLSFSQGTEKVSFVLHLGQNLPDTTGSGVQQSTIPVTGDNQTVALGVGAGILLLATYFYITGDPRRKSIFEAKMLKED